MSLPELPERYTLTQGLQVGRAAARFGVLPSVLRSLPPAEVAECVAIDLLMRQQEDRQAAAGLLRKV